MLDTGNVLCMCVPDVFLKNAPPVDTAARHRMAVLALGEKAQEPSFYEPYTVDNQSPTQSSAAGSSQVVPQSSESMDHQPTQEPTSAAIPPVVGGDTSSVKSMVDFINELDGRFGSSTAACTRVVNRLRNVQTGSQWDTFLYSCGGAVPLHRHHRAAIRVQPTSVARRRPGISRGSKRVAGGRPPSTDPMRRVVWRHRYLSYNVQKNQPNSKSHDEGH